MFAKDTKWGEERAGQPHENWMLADEVDLARPSRQLPFSPDEALGAIKSNGMFDYQVAASDQHLAEHQALNEYRLRSTLPLLSETGEGPVILGTGTLFEHEGRCFIVTADHIFRSDADDPRSTLIDRSMVHFPIEPRRPTDTLASMTMLGRHALHHFLHPREVDVIVVELLDPGTIAILRQGWDFLPFSQGGDLEEADDRFVITGFMHKGARYDSKRNTLSQAMLNLETDLLHYTPRLRTLVPEFDLFLHLQTNGTTVDGVRRTVESLDGLSGGPIWTFRDLPPTDVWAASKAMRIVAIQSGEASHDKTWARGFRWSAVLEILRRSDVGFRCPP